MKRKYSSYKNSLERFLASHKGKRTINLVYSWSAAFVILGALFKLLHFPFANEVLFVSMITECLVFFISGFEKPEETYNWEEVFPELIEGHDSGKTSRHFSTRQQGWSSSLAEILPKEDLYQLSEGIKALGLAAQKLASIGNDSNKMLDSYEALNLDYKSVSEGTEKYLAGVEDLARNIAGLNTIYEIQLKGISSQIEAIDEINAGLHKIQSMYADTVVDSEAFRTENENLAKQLKQLNIVYARMLEAMTVNMGTSMAQEKNPDA